MNVIETLKAKKKSIIAIVIVIVVFFIYHNLLKADLKYNGVIQSSSVNLSR